MGASGIIAEIRGAKCLCGFVGMLIGVVIFFVGCDRQKSAAEKAPTLVVSPPHIDLGGIPEGESKWAMFKVTNNSAASIKITKLTSSCGCTSAKIDADTIPPGESAMLKAEMSNHGRVGKFGARVTMNWSDEAGNIAETLSATTEAEAYQLAIIKPGNLDLGTIAMDSDEVTAQIRILNGNSPTRWSRLEAQSDSPNLSAATIPDSENGSTAVMVKFDRRNLPQGRFRDSVILRFLDEAGNTVGEHPLPIQALIDGPIEIKPTSLYFGIVKGNSPIDGELSIRSRDGSAVEVTGIDSSELAKSLSFGDVVRTSGLVRLPYSFKAPSVEGNVSATIQVTVRCEEGVSVLKIPVICFVKI